ncbi:MAG: hypothetical protein AAFN51_02050 [Pseudomonadota bacterium]
MYGKPIQCNVGYCLVDPEAGFAFEPPRTVLSGRAAPLGPRAVQNCPAVNGLERQLVEIPSPIGLRMSLQIQNGELGLAINPKGTIADPEVLGKMLYVEQQQHWRDPKRPILSLKLPWFFVTDEPCMVSILPPFLGAEMRRWPGAMVVGRYPVTDWPKSLTWSIEWEDFNAELILRQGEPLAYASFEFDNPNKRPKLVEAEMTDALSEYRAGIDGVHHLTNQIEELWSSARERRPAQLLTDPTGADT